MWVLVLDSQHAMPLEYSFYALAITALMDSADLFAFGILLFELLTGRRPFQGATFAESSASIRCFMRVSELTRARSSSGPRG